MATTTKPMLWLRIAKTFHSVVGEVVARQGVVISAVIHSRYPKPKRPLSWRSKRGLLPASSSLSLEHPGHPELLRRVPQAPIGPTVQPNVMIKGVNHSSHCQMHLAQALEQETVVLAMRGARAWLSVPDVMPLQVVVREVFNFPCRPTTLDLPQPDISRTSNVEEVKMAMVERPRETSMVIGDSRVIIRPKRKNSRNMHPSEISLNPKFPTPMVFSLAIEFEAL